MMSLIIEKMQLIVLIIVAWWFPFPGVTPPRNEFSYTLFILFWCSLSPKDFFKYFIENAQ